MRCSTYANSQVNYLDTIQIVDHATSFVNSSHVSLTTIGIITIVFLLLSSCATLTEDERAEREYARENSLILAREEYQRRTVSCQKIGGMMQITRFSSSKFGAFTEREYRMALCVTY